MAHFILSSGYDLIDSLDIDDITNFIVEKKGYVVGPVDKDGMRPLTLTILVRGQTTDSLNQNQANLSWKLEQAERADGPNGVGLPVILWTKLGDNESWTYWTVAHGTVEYTEKETSAPDRQMEAKVVLTCYPYGTADPVLLATSPATDSAHPIFIPDVGGDCHALGKLIIEDTGTVPIGGLTVARRGHRNLFKTGFTPHYPLSGSQTLSDTDWHTVDTFFSPQGDFDIGLFDLVFRVTDGAKPLLPITDLDGILLPTGNLLGGFNEYVVTSLDAFGKESAQSDPFTIQLPTGSILIQDPNPDPKSLKWSGPLFLGGTCSNPGAFSIDLPGNVVSTPSGLRFVCESDGWVLSDTITQPLLIPNVPGSNVAPTNKRPPKSGDLGYSFTILDAAFAPPTTGQLQYQYDLDISSLSLGPLASPVFFAQAAPFGLMRSPYGWAFYCSSANTSEAVDTLVGDWKSGKLLFTVFDSNVLASGKHTILIKADWRNGPLTGSLSIDGQEVATLDSGRTGAAASDVSIGLVITNELPEFTYQRIVNPDQSSWSYTKVEVSTSSDSNSSSSSNSSTSNSNNSDSDSDSSSNSHSHSGSLSDSKSSNNSHSSSTGGGSSNNTSDNGGSNGSTTSSTGATFSGSGSSSTKGDGSTTGTTTSHNKSSSTDTSSSSSNSQGQSGSGGLSDSDSTNTSNSHSSSHSSSTGLSSSSSGNSSSSHSESANASYSFDVPLSSYTRRVTFVEQVVTKTVSTSSGSSSSSSSSNNQSTSDSSSDSHGNSLSTSDSGSDGGGSDSSKSTSSNSSGGGTSSDSHSLSSGVSTDAGIAGDGGMTFTSNSNSSHDDSTSSGDNLSGSSSTSDSNSDNTSHSTSQSTSHSTNSSLSTSSSSSGSSSLSESSSSDSSKSTSIQIQHVYLVQPLIETAQPNTGGSLAQCSAQYSNILLADGPIGTGDSVKLNWTPVTNAATQRVYRIVNTGAGSPANQWQYKALGGADATFTDSDQNGWTNGTPPEGLGPQGSLFRIGYASSFLEPLKYTRPVQANLSNGLPEFLRVSTLTLPNEPRPEPFNPTPGPFVIFLQVQTNDDTVVQHPVVSTDGCWLLSQNEAQFFATYPGINAQSLHFELDTRRDRRNSAIANRISDGIRVAALSAKGELTLSPGGNYLTILATDSNGVADPNIRFTAKVVYTPRTEFMFGLG